MSLNDIVFGDGDIQNFLVELPEGLVLNLPDDILMETNSNQGCLCLETLLVSVVDVPETIVLSDGQLAKRITNKFYLKL